MNGCVVGHENTSFKLSVEDEKHEGATLSFKNELDDEKGSTTLMHFIMKYLFCDMTKRYHQR